ncbi:MAG: hypothetical protein IKK92_06905 [Prevotella sp.]|nr:hypothetical protein [Prevotella sp.]MBR6804515.1 hypothetical protein [Paludibacteraceae bacterium]
MRIEHLPYEGTGFGQRRMESYMLHYRGYYGNTNEQFKSLEQMEAFADNLKKTIRKYRKNMAKL